MRRNERKKHKPTDRKKKQEEKTGLCLVTDTTLTVLLAALTVLAAIYLRLIAVIAQVYVCR